MLVSKLTREIEVFENQRYVFTQFSSKSLLPTDRRAYSTVDGAISWSTVEEAGKRLYPCSRSFHHIAFDVIILFADAALLSAGWEWTAEGSPWTADKDYPNTDGEGWAYDVDFGTFQNASGVKKMVHFVRRRRLTRIQDFDGKLGSSAT